MSPTHLINMIKRLFQPGPVRLFSIPIIVVLCLTSTPPAGSTSDDIDLEACSYVCSYRDTYFAAVCTDLHLVRIPPHAGLCKRARTLNLENNDIINVHPNDLIQYTSLQYLYFGYNKIGEIPPNMCGNVTGLEHLQLNNNKITTIANNAFSYLNALEELVLDSNAIRDLHSGAFNGLSSLRTLQLHDNNISAVPSYVFANLRSLETLNLDRNSIDEIYEDSFSGLTSLVRLSAQTNFISELGVNTFQSLANLNVLVLDGNDLTTIDARMFRGLALEKLSLINNNITTIRNLKAWLSDNTSLKSITLAKNPLHCDCEMEPLRTWLVENAPEEDLNTCASPAEFSGKRLVDIKLNLCHSVGGFTTQSKFSLGVGGSQSVGSDDTWKIIIVACVVFLALVVVVGAFFFLIQKRRGGEREVESGPVQYTSVNSSSATFDPHHRRRITSETQLMSDVDSASGAYDSYTIPPDAREFNPRSARNGIAIRNGHSRAPLVKQASTGSVTTSPDISVATTPDANSVSKPLKFTISEPDIPELEFDADGTCTTLGQSAPPAGRNIRRNSPPQYPPPPPPPSSSNHHMLSSTPHGTNTGYLSLPIQNVNT